MAYLNTKAQKDTTYDAIVIGSGISGGWAAKELCEKGLKTLVGTWISDDLENNELEIENAIRLAKQGHVDMLAIGNEVLLRKDLEIEELLEYIYKIN